MLRCRPDERRYALNIRCASLLGDCRHDDLYQAWLPRPEDVKGFDSSDDGLVDMVAPRLEPTWPGCPGLQM